ncbi:MULTISPECIES: hypothetical protein [Thermoanaerobacterium]|uniref:Uncharacterized protein n=2 Tax=Thermoanaerobacterium TaxID=28895 RepID=W9ECM8_9THEO|nr:MULTISPECIES: hypothetical protein [Thermoanaerobacterium]AFK85895.1 hypothetical protein Tsac_0879 [Thermoanaerobacterium saccharolyticum JW/SL-YS485]ETO38765.1 hypothetical protein V518_1187 [Thermoanaerobacterium aotearoense SCUT27]
MEKLVKNITAILITIFMLTSTAYAGYTLSNGQTVTWTGGNNIVVTDSSGKVVYSGAGVRSGDHLIPPTLVSSNGTITATITSNDDNDMNGTITVTPSYSIGGTNYYYTGSDSTLVTVNSSGQYGTVSAERNGDRVIPTSYNTDPQMAAAINAAINATGGWYNNSENIGIQYNGNNTNILNGTNLGNANIVGTAQVQIKMPDGTTELVPAVDFEGGWASSGAYVIPYSQLTPDEITQLKKSGAAYDDKTGVFIMQFTKEQQQFSSGVTWQPLVGQVLTNMGFIDNSVETYFQQQGIDYEGITISELAPGSEIMNKLYSYLNQLYEENPDAMWTATVNQDLINYIKNNDPTGFTDLFLNYATHSGVATLVLPGDNSGTSSSTSTGTSTGTSSSSSTTTGISIDNPPEQNTADDVHGTITINKTPNFVFTEYHKDANGYPAYMDITIKWQNIQIGHIMDTPGGKTEIRSNAIVSNVVAFHNIHRYTNYALPSDNYETEYPVEQNLDLAHNQATFRFMYRKAGQTDSTLYFKLYLNGTDKYFCVYVNIPVNGFTTTFFNDGKDHSNYGFDTSNPNYKQTTIQTETITF